MEQTSLEDFFSLDDFSGEDREEKTVEDRKEEVEKKTVEEEKSTISSAISDLKDPDRKSRCSICGSWVGVLHGGSILLYYDRGFKALADIDHVYDRCIEGLKENIKVMYKMYVYFKVKGYNVIGVGKAYDDDLYLYVRDKRVDEEEFNGLKVVVFECHSLGDFLKYHMYMQDVDEETIREALEGVRE